MATGSDSPSLISQQRNLTDSDLDLRRIGKPGQVNICQAYTSFKESLADVRRAYRHFNPNVDQTPRDSNGKVMEQFAVEQIMRGAVISVLSIWEHYVLNLLSEAFNHVVHIDSTTSTPEDSSDDSSCEQPGAYRELRKIKKEWPNCQKLIQDAIRRRSERTRRPPEVVTFKLLTTACPHLKLLKEHRNHVLQSCSPLLLGDGGIDETFFSLFSVKKTKTGVLTMTLTHAIMSLGLQYSFTASDGKIGNVKFKSAVAINDILRLYYGARCIFSHGLPSRTLNEGAMRNFPNEEKLKDNVGFSSAGEDFTRLFNRLRTMGRKAFLSYLDLCMMYRFFFRLANRLMVAVAIQVHNLSPNSPPLWQYNHYFLRHLKLLYDLQEDEDEQD